MGPAKDVYSSQDSSPTKSHSPSDRISSLSSSGPASGPSEQLPCHPTTCAYLGFLASYPLGFHSAWGSPPGWPLGFEMKKLAGGLIHDLNSALSHN